MSYDPGNTLKARFASKLRSELFNTLASAHLPTCSPYENDETAEEHEYVEIFCPWWREDGKGFEPEDFAYSSANDIVELIMHGDTSSKDKYLALLDGLKKRTSWPKEVDFYVHALERKQEWDSKGIEYYLANVKIRFIEHESKEAGEGKADER